MELIVENGYIGGVPLASVSPNPYRGNVFAAIRKHARKTLGYPGYVRLEQAWIYASGDGPYISYARDHWDEIVTMIVKERLCS